MTNVANGTLVREQSSSTVYAVHSGRRVPLPSGPSVGFLGHTAGDVVVVPDGSLDDLPVATVSSLSATPGSFVFHPDGRRHFAITSLPSALPLLAAGHEIRLIEVRGWLHPDEAITNTESEWDDWHYYLELDTAWAADQGIDLHALLRVGNIHEYGEFAEGSDRARTSLPRIGLEINAWKPGNSRKLPLPSDWTFPVDGSPAGNDFAASPKGQEYSQDRWPFDPRFADGQYVRVAGSLIVDSRHTGDGLWLWERDQGELDPAKHTEIHPPDLILPLPNPGRREAVRGVAVIAGTGLFDAASQALDTVLRPPGPRPSLRHRCAVIEDVGPETNYSTISEGNADLSGARITLAAESASVHVAVTRTGIWGSRGRFKALYRTSWTGPTDRATIRYSTTVDLWHALSGGYLSSTRTPYTHAGTSGQQMVNCPHVAGPGGRWRIKPPDGMAPDARSGAPVQHGEVIRLEHLSTGRHLHSHAGFPSPLTGQQEVTCFGSQGHGDGNDNWVVEVEGQGVWTTDRQVRLIHQATGHALHSHAGWAHPVWTAGEQEVTAYAGRDDNDLWFASGLLERDARFLEQRVPTRVDTGQRFPVMVAMRNTGTNTWTPGVYRLGSQSPQDNTLWGLGRVELTRPVKPGERHDFTFVVTAPSTAGTPDFSWRMLEELVTWFGDFTPVLSVQVAPAGSAVVPEVVGEPSGYAARQIRSAGLVPVFTGGGQWVRAQSPVGGSTIPLGATVTCRLTVRVPT